MTDAPMSTVTHSAPMTTLPTAALQVAELSALPEGAPYATRVSGVDIVLIRQDELFRRCTGAAHTAVP